MPILNMTYGQGNPYQPFHLNAISDLSATPGNGEATITWTDPGNLVVDSQTLATWVSTKLVRKVGSAPTTSSDGTLVVTETVADTYSSNGYVDTGLTNGTTYYYGAFAVADNGTEIISNTVNVTPDNSRQPGANTVLYLPFDTDLLDHSGNNYSLTQQGTVSISNGAAYFDGGYLYNNTDKVLQQMPATVSLRVNSDNIIVANGEQDIISSNKYSSGYKGWNIIQVQGEFRSEVLSGGSVFSTVTPSANTRYLITLTMENGTSTLYVNGVSQGTNGCSVIMQDRFAIGSSNRTNGDLGQNLFTGHISNVIIEDKAWTAQEVSDYFDLTKGDYGIS